MNTIGCEKKGRVLIIDDQPDNIRVLANILQEHYDVQAATDGCKALEIASGKNTPDVILLDIVMPEMDGYEVCRRFKADDRTRDIPVIFVTVKDSAEDEEYGFNLGAVDYISKPFQPAVIRVRVKSQIEQQQSKNIIQQHLQDKELLLREVHHRIKNNITFIVSLLDLHAGSTTNLEAQSVLRMARSRVDSMGVLYDKLLSTENYRDIFVKNYLEDLIASIERLFPDYEAITLNKEIDAFNLDTKRLFPLGLIVNELITNCIKYGFRGKASGTIDIVLARQGQGIVLTVQDDGDGFPENFDLKTSTGFGLRLVQMLTRQIKGTFTMSSDHGAKSVVTFEL